MAGYSMAAMVTIRDDWLSGIRTLALYRAVVCIGHSCFQCHFRLRMPIIVWRPWRSRSSRDTRLAGTGRLRKRNSLFACGELCRLAVELLREAPLMIREMAIGRQSGNGLRSPGIGEP